MLPQPRTTDYIKTKYHDFADFLSDASSAERKKQSALQYLKIYEKTKEKNKPVVVELGTWKGFSTTAFLQACHENGGHLYSVDIKDYSDVAAGNPQWTFIQNDSTDVQGIIGKAPKLKDGIDVLLIDSYHIRHHVEKEFYNWAPYLNKNAIIFFDDVDPFIYRAGERKDHRNNEFHWEDIQDFVIELFRANEDNMTLEMLFGSSGLAVLEKQSEKGAPLNKAVKAKYRTRSFWSQLKFRLSQIKNHD
ncbi:MAG: hypothetical protein DI551_06300 [Micavibrio aeruginosavorus]|uniref:Class I SAM-dependent methyltransferase n=1 Tax=Micavibrio aeruginosavorus TaxID=349221 RepID=A0A2W5PTR2_9BACT|nr:MAG: hypothetical protein DI551_06300 [Micavibrio aeruginosavorus]